MLLVAGCALVEEAPLAERRPAGEARASQDDGWPRLADVPAGPRPGSSPAALAALRAKLEAERAAQEAARADRDGKSME
ncbi:MAG: hypothetical protein OXF26_08860 [Alphaproteobacteria bacterium]|nr:hypothetical protein [Alphaproteobacteria bacterium]